jgi:Protein of unknown function (DUF3631)
MYLTLRSELASNISPSALFRYVEHIKPTLLIDEADSFVGASDELRGILNSGHTRVAANVIRNVEVNGEHLPRRFSVWCPKAIATIRDLADTLEDRSIIINLQRKPKTAKLVRLRKRDCAEFAVLRSKAARWATDNFDVLAADPEPEMPDELNDRAADNWRPLIAIADLVGGEWPHRAREAACLLSGAGHEAKSVNVELLVDIRLAFGDDEHMRSVDLVEALNTDQERPWATWNKGKPISQKQLANLLRPFGIISETFRGWRTPKAISGKGSKRHGPPILVKTPFLTLVRLLKRATVQMAMKWALLAVFYPCKKHLRTDRKAATCPTAIRVCTLARIKMPRRVRKMVLTRLSRKPGHSCAITAAALPRSAIRFWCPFCADWRHHSAGAGHRASHCDHWPDRYVLRLRPDATGTIQELRRLQEKRRLNWQKRAAAARNEKAERAAAKRFLEDQASD